MNVSPEEYRKRKLAVQRQTVRTVRNTLIMLAVLAGIWYIYLVCEARRARYAEMPPPAGPTISSADKTAAPDNSLPAESDVKGDVKGDVKADSPEKKSMDSKEGGNSSKENESAKPEKSVKPVDTTGSGGQPGEVKPNAGEVKPNSSSPSGEVKPGSKSAGEKK